VKKIPADAFNQSRDRLQPPTDLKDERTLCLTPSQFHLLYVAQPLFSTFCFSKLLVNFVDDGTAAVAYREINRKRPTFFADTIILSVGTPAKDERANASFFLQNEWRCVLTSLHAFVDVFLLTNASSPP